MINNWGCNEDYYLALCILTVSKERFDSTFLEKVLRINQKHGVNQLVCKESGDPVDLYMNDLKKHPKKLAVTLNFTSIFRFTYDCKYNIIDRAFYYDKNGALLDAKVSLLGLELRKLNDTDESKTNMGYVGPIHLWNAYNKDTIEFHLQLHSDIYFPIVANKYKISEEFYPNEKWIDNKELATLNTKIFNDWFTELSLLFTENKGSIELDGSPGICPEHQAELTTNGIMHITPKNDDL